MSLAPPRSNRPMLSDKTLIKFTLILLVGGACAKSPAGDALTSLGTGAGAGTDGTTGDSPESTGGSEEGTSSGVLDIGDASTAGDDPDPVTCDSLLDHPKTSLGCEFYAVDYPWAWGTARFEADELGFGVSIGNPSPEPVNITVEDRRGPNASLRELASFVVEPKSSVLVPLNGNNASVGLEDGLLEGSHRPEPGLNPQLAFRIRSDAPVAVSQINPVGGAPSREPEASLLLPTGSLGAQYIAVGYDALSGLDGTKGHALVVGVEDGTTLSLAGGVTVLLDAFDVFDIEAAGSGDITGTAIVSDRPVAVFSGSPCARVPADAHACDRLEEQVFPLAAWGKESVGMATPNLSTAMVGDTQKTVWRIIAGADATEVEFSPALGDGLVESVLLEKQGDVFEIESELNFLASGSAPFLLVQYAEGCERNWGEFPFDEAGCKTADDTAVFGDAGAPYGDPAMAQMVPVEQWIWETPFLTDVSYPADYLTIARTSGTQVFVDCMGMVDDALFDAIPETDYEVGTVFLDAVDGNGPCEDGARYVSAGAPIGVIVGGAGNYAGYSYPGGLSVEPSWVPPPPID